MRILYNLINILKSNRMKVKMIYKLIVTVLIISALFIGCASLNNSQQIDINGKTVEYILKGSGSPTIVFETGMGPTIDTWNSILDSLSKHTQVYAYNRPGYGNSQIHNPPTTVIEVAAQLRENLMGHNIKPPYILVGHSAGGLYINMFARLFPEEVAGAVFIDASHPEQFEYFKNDQSLLYELLITATKKGNRTYEGNIVKTTLQSFENASKFPNVPISVLTAGKKSSPLENDELRNKWLQFQKSLASLSPISEHIVVENTGHYIHKRNPNISISEILRILSISEKK